MGLFVNTNTASINAQRNMNNTTRSLGQSFQRLSSGLRINSAKDDAAGLAVSEGMRAEISGMKQAVNNAEAGMGMIQLAEGARLCLLSKAQVNARLQRGGGCREPSMAQGMRSRPVESGLRARRCRVAERRRTSISTACSRTLARWTRGRCGCGSTFR